VAATTTAPPPTTAPPTTTVAATTTAPPPTTAPPTTTVAATTTAPPPTTAPPTTTVAATTTAPPPTTAPPTTTVAATTTAPPPTTAAPTTMIPSTTTSTTATPPVAALAGVKWEVGGVGIPGMDLDGHDLNVLGGFGLPAVMTGGGPSGGVTVTWVSEDRTSCDIRMQRGTKFIKVLGRGQCVFSVELKDRDASQHDPGVFRLIKIEDGLVATASSVTKEAWGVLPDWVRSILTDSYVEYPVGATISADSFKRLPAFELAP
ncbi:uncharacterized protein METZ01_LOCUS194816, partial [marine metagenome]